MNMQLFDWQNSYNSRKIRAVAFELDMRIDPIAVDLMNGASRTPDFLAMNPNGKVPVLKDGSFTLWESNAILCYVASKDPARRLLPADPAQRAKVDQWLYWQSAHLSPSIGKIAFEVIWKERMGRGKADPAVIAEAMPDVTRFLGVLETTLTKTSWVAGSDLSVADFACAAAFFSRKEISLDLTSYPHITTWLNTMEARPSWTNSAW